MFCNVEDPESRTDFHLIHRKIMLNTGKLFLGFLLLENCKLLSQ